MKNIKNEKNKFKLFKNGIATLPLITLSFLPISCTPPKSDTNKITIEDMVGDKVNITKNPKKVACISRTSYDLLVAFGLEKNIAGVFSNIKNNPWTKFFDENIDKKATLKYKESEESLLSQNVDLVFSPEKYLSDMWNKVGIPAATISLYHNNGFKNYVYYYADLITKIWDSKEVKQKAETWKNLMQKAIDEVSQKISKSNLPKKSIYYVRGDKNRGVNYTDNGNSFIEYIYSDLFNLDYIGKRFITPQPSIEEVIKANPDFISLGGTYQNDLRKTLLKDYSHLQDIKNNKYFNIPLGLTPFEQLNIFSSAFIYDQANKIYPELFKFDVKNEIIKISKIFFNKDLSNELVDRMLKGLPFNG